MLLDGPQAYARELHDHGSVNKALDGRTWQSSTLDSRPGPNNTRHEGNKAKDCSATTEDLSGRHRCHHLMGDAVWRQQLLQRVGWIVVRVHWQDWSEADRADDGGGKARLLRSLVSECGLMTQPSAPSKQSH